MDDDGAILLDLCQEVLSVEQLCQDASSLVHHFQPLCLQLDLDDIGSNVRDATRL